MEIISLYRAMCNQEASETLRYNSLSWNSRFKWFGTENFVKERVKDGRFNNSKYVPNRYCRLLKFEFTKESLKHFNKCGNREFMLDVRKVPFVKVLSIQEIEDN